MWILPNRSRTRGRPDISAGSPIYTPPSPTYLGVVTSSLSRVVITSDFAAEDANLSFAIVHHPRISVETKVDDPSASATQVDRTRVIDGCVSEGW